MTTRLNAKVEAVLWLVRSCKAENPDFTLDDALWCYAFDTGSPNNHARLRVYRECGVQSKVALIDWCDAHSHAEALAILDAILGPCGHDSLNGIDQTPLDDPAKLWRCATCGDVLLSGGRVP